MAAGSPTGYLSAIHTDDVASAVVAAIDAPTGIYNVGDDEPLTKCDYVDAFASAFGLPRLHMIPTWAARLAGGPSSVWGDPVVAHQQPQAARNDRMGAPISECPRGLGRGSRPAGRRASDEPGGRRGS